MRIDFQHTSLFGAYREDASIYITNDKIMIYDRERERFYDNDTSIALLSGHLGLEISPDDLLHVLMLDRPDCGALEMADGVVDGDEWTVTGRWRGREIRLSGDNERGTTLFEQCSEDKTICYKISYGYSRRAGAFRYPKRIVIESERGTERISMQVLDVTPGTDMRDRSYREGEGVKRTDPTP